MQSVAYIWILVLISAVVLWIYMLSQKDKQIAESFTNPNARSCDTYFVPVNQVRACDKGYFTMNLLTLNHQKAQLEQKTNRTAEEDENLLDMQRALTARANNTEAGNMVCKFTWANMEQNKDPEKDAVKNIGDPNTVLRNGQLADGSPNPNSGDWAFCYGAAPSEEQANTIKTQFGDKGAVKADAVLSAANSPFGDNQTYVRYQFSSLQKNALQDAYCTIAPSSAQKLPANFPEVLFGFSVNTMNYRIDPKVDYWGNDIACYGGGESVQKCVSECDGNAACKGAVEVLPNGVWGGDSGCCLKHRLQNSHFYNNNGVNFYVKQSQQDQVKVANIGVYVKKNDTTIEQYPDPVPVFRRMIELYFNAADKGIYVREKTRNAAKVRVLAYDPCGRAAETNTISVPLTNNAFGVAPFKILNVSYPENFNGQTGSEGLSAKVAEYNSTITQKQQEQGALEAVNSQPNYRQGVYVDTYQITRGSTSQSCHRRYDWRRARRVNRCTTIENPPVGNTATDLDTLFTNNATYVSRHIATNMNFYDWDQKRGAKMSGFVRVSSGGSLRPGEYQFMLNSDDGADMQVNGQYVSSHYGYHGMDRGGRSLGVFTLSEGYHPFLVRMFQWGGPRGLEVTYRYRATAQNNWSGWSRIPAMALYCDGTPINNRAAIENLKTQILDLENKMKEANDLLNLFATIPDSHVRTFMTRALGRTLGSISDVSSQLSTDGKIYMDYDLTASSIPITI